MDVYRLYASNITSRNNQHITERERSVTVFRRLYFDFLITFDELIGCSYANWTFQNTPLYSALIFASAIFIISNTYFTLIIISDFLIRLAPLPWLNGKFLISKISNRRTICTLPSSTVFCIWFGNDTPQQSSSLKLIARLIGINPFTNKTIGIVAVEWMSHPRHVECDLHCYYYFIIGQQKSMSN